MASPTKRPRYVDPEVWALIVVLRQARDRLPFAAAEARLVDGVHRFVRTEAVAGSGSTEDAVFLRAEGPRWAAVLSLVTAVARVCSEPTRRLLAPWCPGGVAPSPAPAPGVSPHRSAAAGFGAGTVVVGEEGAAPGPGGAATAPAAPGEG